MVWIGGAPGAGKSTIARGLARRADLPLHPVDLWTYAHLDRLPPLRPLTEELAEGPDSAAKAFVGVARLRLDLVVADVRERDLGDVPAVVEGPQLFPSMADSVPAAVWLLPDAEQTRRAREERLARADDPAGRARPGAELSRQRRYENLAACRQGRLWQADIGLAELPPYPFACECGTSGCATTWAGTPDEYDARRDQGWLTAHPAC